jgi:hypothetical protein
LANSDRRAPLQVLVAGGDQDPNLRALLATLGQRGAAPTFLAVGAASHPWLAWDPAGDELLLGGEPCRPQAAFVRYDVFTHMADGRPESSFRAGAWYTAVLGYLAAHPEVKLFNRRSLFGQTNKPYMLAVAKRAGLEIPATLVGNHLPGLAAWRAGEKKIVKPINGGAHTQRLDAVMAAAPSRDGVLAAPAIVQEELVPPEVRVFRVGDKYFAFDVASPDLDYREHQNVRLTFLEKVPQGLETGLAALTDEVGLDFAAADFKTCPRSGQLIFLEVNTSPMFVAFDRAAGGALTAAMAEWLGG